MSIDPTISLRVVPPPELKSPFETMMRYEGLREMQQTRQLREMQIENTKASAADRQRQLADEATVKRIVGSRTNPKGETAWNDVIGDLNREGLAEIAARVQDQMWQSQESTLKQQGLEADTWLKKMAVMQAAVESAADDATTRMARTVITKIGGPEYGGLIPNVYGDGAWKEGLGALSAQAVKALKEQQELANARAKVLSDEREGKLKSHELFTKKVETAAGWLAARSRDQGTYEAALSQLRAFGEDRAVLERFPTEFKSQDAILQIGMTANQQATESRQDRAQAFTQAHQRWLEAAPTRDKAKRAAERPLEVAQRIAAIVNKAGTVEAAQQAWQAESGQYLTAYPDLDVEWANRALRGYYQGVTGAADESDAAFDEIMKKIAGGGETKPGAVKPPPKPKAGEIPAEVQTLLKNAAAGAKVKSDDGTEEYVKQADGSVKRTK